MYYVDPNLLVFIEDPDVSVVLDRWISIWEETLHSKFLLGPFGSKVSHTIKVLGCQIVVITSSDTVEEKFQMRLGVAECDYDFNDPEFYTIHPDDWYEPDEEKNWQ